MSEDTNIHTGAYEGRQDHVRDLKFPEIEVFANIYPGKSYRIDMEIPEFTAICPKTGLPDFGILYLAYKPAEFCLELKSLKEYVTAYRNVGIFHENVVNRMLDDLVKACKPRWMRLHGDYNVRGGIKTRVTATYSAPNE
ncbi:MAG TPA: NADPH-dependent 7-cyano-7-deazaguanine reductase QueF [Leptospiraceae bacterium]|nr:NADPH-dependent 7-cyano-7-deazaguanine reductase QueF [Spirochaetaceae bacterium]HBS05980.1 NADPH-dependent 7-cyano-7-deazaguanine reductase QueF [Leptospiraceae bacterium]|tara:strand:- start:24845 stop:25261 length:417 start_codon:yes stop_codon:yes gene_type:complete